MIDEIKEPDAMQQDEASLAEKQSVPNESGSHDQQKVVQNVEEASAEKAQSAEHASVEQASDESRFASVRNRLEEIANKVGDENISLDEALDLYEKAITLGLQASDLLEVGIVVTEEDVEQEDSGQAQHVTSQEDSGQAQHVTLQEDSGQAQHVTLQENQALHSSDSSL